MTKIDSALYKRDTKKQNKEIKFNLYIPYKPKNEKKNQLNITVLKNKAPKKKKTGKSEKYEISEKSTAGTTRKGIKLQHQVKKSL